MTISTLISVSPRISDLAARAHARHFTLNTRGVGNHPSMAELAVREALALVSRTERPSDAADNDPGRMIPTDLRWMPRIPALALAEALDSFIAAEIS